MRVSFSFWIVDAFVLFLLALWAPGVQIDRLIDAVRLVLAVSIIQGMVWWLFINFFAHLPALLFPIITFVLIGIAITFFGNYIPGITISSFASGIQIAMVLTVVNAILGSILMLDEDASFDRPGMRWRKGKKKGELPECNAHIKKFALEPRFEQFVEYSQIALPTALMHAERYSANRSINQGSPTLSTQWWSGWEFIEAFSLFVGIIRESERKEKPRNTFARFTHPAFLLANTGQAMR